MILQLDRLSESVKTFTKLYPQGGLFGLRGPLGVGKTTWVKAFVKVLSEQTAMPNPRVVSPSFVIHQVYETQPRVEHFDFYRLEILSSESLIEIGYWEAVERAQQEQGYVFVEWPEKAPLAILQLTAELHLSFLADSTQQRNLEIRPVR